MNPYIFLIFKPGTLFEDHACVYLRYSTRLLRSPFVELSTIFKVLVKTPLFVPEKVIPNRIFIYP